MLGDVNGDGRINAIDASILIQYLRGNCEITYNGAADADMDLVLTPADVDLINKHVAGTVTLSAVQNELTIPNMRALNYTLYDCENETTSTYTLTANVQSLSLEDEPMPTAGYIDNRMPSSETAVVIAGAGSGFIIDDHVVATAAHCVYDRDTSSFIDVIDVVVKNEDCTSEQTFHAKEVHILTSYMTVENDCKYDYALIYVDEDLSNYGKFDLGVPSTEFMTSNSTVFVSGFPSAVNGVEVSGVRYNAAGNIEDICEYDSTLINHQIRYSTYTSGGQSGGPVYIKTTYGGQEHCTAIGINTSGAAPHYYGTRMTASLLRFYKNNDYIGSTVS